MSHTHRLSIMGVRSTAALALGLALGMLGPVAPAQAAMPSAPSGLAVSQPNDATTILSWAPSDNAATYRVQIDDDLGFASPAVNATTANTTFVPKTKLAAGTWYWHVQAIGSLGETTAWTFSSFATAPISTPVPATPVNGADLQQPEDAPLLSWSVSPGAVAYKVELSKNDFSSFDSWTTQSTSFIVPKPLSLGEWKWRVLAYKSRNPDVTSLPSEPQSFNILALRAPVITGPDEAAVTDVVLDWDPVEGAKGYELQVSKNSDFSDLIDSRTGAQNIVYGTSYSPPTTYDNNDTLYWRVRAVDTAGNPSAWARTTVPFKRHFPGVPTLLYPPIGALDVPDPLYFDWTAVSHASEYEFQLASDSEFKENLRMCRVSGTTYTPGLFRYLDTDDPILIQGEEEECNPIPGTTNHWRVRAVDAPFTNPAEQYRGVKANDWSAKGSFKYGGVALNNISTSLDGLPTISWDPVPGVQKYELTLAGPAPQTIESRVTTYATSWTPDGQAVKAAGTYTLTVTAVTVKGVKSLTHRRTFTIGSTIPTTAADPLTLMSPAQDAVVTGIPAMRWEPQADAAYYRVFVTDSDGNAVVASDGLIEKPVAYPAMTDTSTRLKKPGAYRWRVVAYGTDGLQRGVSGEGRFTVPQIPAPVGQALALGGSEVDPANAGTPCKPSPDAQVSVCQVPATPVLKWDPVPDTAFYIVYVSEDASFTQLLESTRVPATTNTMYAPTLDNIESNYADSESTQDGLTSYYWYVRPCRSLTLCLDTPRSNSNAAQHSFTKKSPPVIGLSHTITRGTEVTLRWNDYWRDPSSTDPADKWAQTQEPLPQTAMKYRVQVSKDSTFADTSLVEQLDVDQTTFTSFKSTYGDGTYWWRVQAIDGDTHTLSWSEPATFTLNGSTSTLLSPETNEVIAGNAAFTWSAQPYAASYDIQVAKNEDASFSQGNLVATGTGLLTTGWAWTNPLAPSESAYLWRVRRTDSFGHKGPWSTVGRFFVAGSVLNITSPGEGGSQPPNGPVLTWDPVTGATTYSVAIAPTSGSGTTDGDTTVATAFASTKAFLTGTYRATISAKDAGGNTLTSASRDFHVDNRLVPDQPVRIVAPQGTGVGKALEAEPPTWVGGFSDVAVTYQWLVDGVVKYGATSKTYTIVAADYGKQVSVKATGKRPAYSDGVSVSESVTVVSGDALVNTTRPTINGVATVSGFLSATTGGWMPSAERYSYQWIRNGSDIGGETRANYQVKSADAGSLLSVRVTASKTGFANGSATSDPVAVAPAGGTGGTAGTLIAIAAPTISGTPKVGSFVTVGTGTWNTPPTGFKYQWYRAGVPIPGATSSMYKAIDVDARKSLTAVVTATRPGWTQGQATTAPVTVAKVTSTTSAFASPAMVKRSQRAKLYITVSAVGVAGPTGKIVIKDGRKKLKAFSLRAGKNGRVTFTLPRLKRIGKHRIKVIYKGNGYIARSKAKTVILKVTR